MSNLISITTLAGEFKNAAELQEYCNAQFISLSNAMKKIEEMKNEIEHLKKLVGGATQVMSTPAPETSLTASPEQAICEMQIKKLQQTAIQRELTLEETKRLDLLIKNLYLAKGQPNQITQTQVRSNLSVDQLLDIASQPEKKIED